MRPIFVVFLLALQLPCAAALAPALPQRRTALRHGQLAMQADGRRASGDWAVPALVCQPVMYWSLYTLKTTDCGLPAGPFGLFGAAEGISYLIVAGVVVAALVKKATTGSGFEDEEGALPLKGLAEGLCFLTAIVGLAVLGAQLLEYGFVPEAVPVEGGRCSNIG